MINTGVVYSPTGEMKVAIKNKMSVHLDDEITLALNRLREEMKRNSAAAGLPPVAPSLGWLARTMLRDKLGLVDGKAAKQDAPGAL